MKEGMLLMKKKILSFLLIGFLVLGLTGCDNNEVSDNKDTNKTKEENNGPYKWEVGKYTLETKTDIMKYIDGDVWNANELAMSLGWDPYSYHISADGRVDNSDNYRLNPKAKVPAYYLNKNIFIRLNAGDNTNYFSVWKKGEGNLYTVQAEQSFGEMKYKINSYDKKLFTKEAIIIFTYALENTDPDKLNNPFEDILYAYDKKNNIYRFDQ